MKAKVLILSFACCLFGQTEGVAPKKNPNPVQVTVSGNHPDALNNESTVIFDNTKNINSNTDSKLFLNKNNKNDKNNKNNGTTTSCCCYSI